MYTRRNTKGEVVLVAATWVDDVLIAGEPEEVEKFRAEIKQTFSVRDFGEPKDFVGCEIDRDINAGIGTFKQTKYIEKMGERYGVQAQKGAGPFAPMDYSLKLTPSAEDDNRVDPTDFRSIVGALHYCAHCTRPDIAAPVSILSKFLADPNVTHMRQARKVLSYLLWSKDIGLTWHRDPHPGPGATKQTPGVISGFADATFADDTETRRSHTGYVFLLNGAAISWVSHQQDKVAQSSSEAEFRAYNSAGREALWLRKLEYDYMSHTQQSKVHPPTMIWDDNESCIKWLKNHCLHSKTKHIETAVLSIRDEMIRYKTLDVEYVPTHAQIADQLTKILTPKQHWSLARHALGARIPTHWFHAEPAQGEIRGRVS
jgi:hypothetical protein